MKLFMLNFMGKSLIFQCLNGGKTEKKPLNCPTLHRALERRTACAQSSTRPLTEGDQLAILHQHLAVHQ
jgi:hypothetical protein